MNLHHVLESQQFSRADLDELFDIAKEMEKAVKSLDNKPSNPKTTADETFLKKFEECARSFS